MPLKSGVSSKGQEELWKINANQCQQWAARCYKQ